jgi:DNA ligase (NAD+)
MPNSNEKSKTLKKRKIIIIDQPVEIIPDKNEPNKTQKKRTIVPGKILHEPNPIVPGSGPRLNESYIELLDTLSSLMMKQGEPFRAKAYQKAQETIVLYEDDIIDPKQLKDAPGIGSTIMSKLQEYKETGTLAILEREKANPANMLADIYGVGPKKAKELVEKGVKTIAELRERQDELLNSVQRTGLKHYEDILARIPRSEIDQYLEQFTKAFTSNGAFEIVGSYRRGAKMSGDIDVIVTSKSDSIFKEFVDRLLEQGIITDVLSRGKSKCLVIGKLPGENRYRRIDFLYTSPEEYPFALLYFTGSKFFNTVMRARALTLGFSLNEHGMTTKGSKTKIEHEFKNERDIFDFLGMVYKEPSLRVDGRAVVLKSMTSPKLESKNELSRKQDTKLEQSHGLSELVQIIPKISLNQKTKKAQEKMEKLNQKTKKAQEKLEKDELKVKKAQEKLEKDELKVKKAQEKLAQKAQEKMEKLAQKTQKAQQRLEKRTTQKKQEKVQLKKPNKKIEIHHVNTDKILSNMELEYKPVDSTILEHVRNFKQRGITVLEALDQETLAEMVRSANSAYYNTQEAVMTDNEYDILKEFIAKKYPKNAVNEEVGAPIVGRNKVTLPFEMPSMDKIKPDTNALVDWKRKYTGPYVISCKLDGVSGMYILEPGNVGKLYTRGNGLVGQDISHLIDHLKLPTVSSRRLVIRGELIMPKSVFASKYAKQFANPRNLVSGIVNRLSVDDKIADLRFVAYEVIEPILKPSEQMLLLQELSNIDVVHNMVMPDITNEFLSEQLIELRKTHEYEIDGIIVANDRVYSRASGNPDHAFAFKMVISDQMAEVKVVDVIWTPSKHGLLKPRVRIEPVALSGVTIEYTTGFNGAFIETNKIGIGAVIQIIRSGDVIPHIMSVTSPAEVAKMPSVPYIWNETHVDVILENAGEDETVREKAIASFFKAIEVVGMGEGNVKRIITAGFDTVPKIVHMSKSDFMKAEGIQDKTATKLSEGIREQLAKASLAKILAASNVIGRGFGETRIVSILEKYPNILMSGESDGQKVAMISSVEGLAGKSAQLFVSKIGSLLEFIRACSLDRLLQGPSETVLIMEKNMVHGENAGLSVVQNVVVDTTHALYKKTVVMTGSRDKAAIEALTRVGAKLASSVNKSTTVLIASDPEELSGKIVDAKKHNVPIMRPTEFMAKYFS